MEPTVRRETSAARLQQMTTGKYRIDAVRPKMFAIDLWIICEKIIDVQGSCCESGQVCCPYGYECDGRKNCKKIARVGNPFIRS
jgi:hypothetical protein